jgi:HAE1 family hydrophobic/amphiphilic exporter-1
LERREKGMRRQEEVEQYLRNRFREVAGIRAYSSMFFSFGDMNTVETEIYGDDLTRAQEIGLDLKRRIEKIPNAADVTFSLEESKPELGIYFDRQRLSALGLSTAQVSQTVSTYFKGTTAGRFRENGREYDILVRAPRDFRESKANLENVALVTPLGQAVPLKNVASVERRMGPVEVTRKNQQRKTTVASTVVGPNMGQVVADIERAIEETKKVEDTSGFTFKVGGAAEDFQESFMWLGIALVAAILLVYMVMASQFESLVSPFIIFFSIPLAAIGVVWILVITRTSVSVAAMIGGIMLVGVVVNNAIVMVDYINQLRAQGQNVAQACYDGGLVRMRPVLMTAMTTILAMFPLALGVGEGAEGWAPMARVAIGGLLVSTLLTLLVIPTIYRMVEGWRERRRLAKESHSP